MTKGYEKCKVKFQRQERHAHTLDLNHRLLICEADNHIAEENSLQEYTADRIDKMLAWRVSLYKDPSVQISTTLLYPFKEEYTVKGTREALSSSCKYIGVVEA